MVSNRRKFLKYAGMAGLSIAGNKITQGFPSGQDSSSTFSSSTIDLTIKTMKQKEENISIIGQYGEWASSLTEDELPSHSFRREEWSDLKKWQKSAVNRLEDRLAIPDIGGIPEVTVKKQYIYDGL